MAYGDLAAISGKDVQAVDADNGNTHHGHDGQHPITEKEGTGEKNDEESEQDPPVPSGAEGSHILRIIFVENPRA
jgi:hypothetical protein